LSYQKAENGTLLFNNLPRNSAVVLNIDNDLTQIRLKSSKSRSSLFNESLGGRVVRAYLESSPVDLTELTGLSEKVAIEISETFFIASINFSEFLLLIPENQDPSVLNYNWTDINKRNGMDIQISLETTKASVQSSTVMFMIG
jgi:hypothetical protein